MRRFRCWPESLFGRTLLILFLGLALAHALTFALVMAERGLAMRGMMLSYLASDVASSVAMLERLPAQERAQWLPRLERRNYRFHLGADPGLPALDSPLARKLSAAVSAALFPARQVRAVDPDIAGTALRLHLRLDDGSALSIDVDAPRMRISPWVLVTLGVQVALLAALCAWAVGSATRPLRALAAAADALGPVGTAPPLPEQGPREVVRAAAAFNRMQARIREHLAERMSILAAISHDLQTPLTRLRLRAELLDESGLRDKLHADVAEMQGLVEQGIAYARAAHAVHEPARRHDLRALLESLVGDYADAGRPVSLQGGPAAPCVTRAQALRRLLCNLVDNALKFAGSAEVAVEPLPAGGWMVRVLDRGPGIPPAARGRVMQPFVRLDDSRNRDGGGSGLGLAIAEQLARALDGRLVLVARDGGGLEARVELP